MTVLLQSLDEASPIDFASQKVAGKVANHDYMTQDAATVVNARRLSSTQIESDDHRYGAVSVTLRMDGRSFFKALL